MLRRLFAKKKKPAPRHAAPVREFTAVVEDQHQRFTHVFCTYSSRGCYLGGKVFHAGTPMQELEIAVAAHEKHHRDHGDAQHDNPFYSP